MLTPVDVPTQHTRVVTLQAAAMGQSIATTCTSDQADSDRILSSDPQSGSATKETIISDDPASPIVPRISERLSQPPERYSPGLFFTDSQYIALYDPLF